MHSSRRGSRLFLSTLGACGLALLGSSCSDAPNGNPTGAKAETEVGAEAAATAPIPEGFTPLFNGTDLSQWWGLTTEDPAIWQALSKRALDAKIESSRADLAQHWRVENGELVNDGAGLYLSTIREYGDFELLIDYKTVAKADSGIYLRGIPQVQIWDHTKAGGKWKHGADKGSGGLWNNAKGAPGKDPMVKADRPFGTWNRFRIHMIGERVSVMLNGQLVVDHARMANYFDREGNLPKSGPIQLQTHGGVIRWRRLFIREIEAEEANDILSRGGPYAETIDPRFKSIFNGQDFSGWKGPTKGYEVTDEGSLRCKKGKVGTIYTEEEFADFVVQLEMKLPPGGNNGLAIRYPGTGNTAYVGMCELQVLDDGDAKWKGRLRPQQCHGSVYGQVAARRGFLRPAGTWNLQRVTVRGSRIAVELNGYTILDADILKDAKYMGKREKFRGRTRSKGHFGFAGHSDPVEFRAIRIRSIQ